MKKRTYLDYAATTPISPEVAHAMEQVLQEEFGNPSSLYREGRNTKALLQNARGIVAQSLGAQSDEIFFTSGGTESNFLAIHGITRALKGKGRHLITSQIEHSSALGAFQSMEEQGYQVTYLPVTADGLVDPGAFRQAIRNDTVFASIMSANNEIGTVQQIRELASIAKEFHVHLHSDAVQAFACLPLNVQSIPVSALSISAHKVYGPKGTGALFMRRGTPFEPPVRGGDQERQVRPGTENVPGIVGFGKAVEILQKERDGEMNRLVVLRNRLREGLFQRLPDCLLNGHPERRLPNNLNITFRHAEGESILIHLDLEGIACSTGSACSAGAVDPSHVLLALGRSQEEAKSSLRITLGKYTQEEDIARVLQVLPPFVEQLRKVSSIGGFA